MTSRIVSEISYPTVAGVGGNYSNDDRTITGESFNFGGDTTVTNCDVFLTTASPQDDVTLTFDSDITVTGQNGNLMFGAMMQAPTMDVATVSSGATIQSGATISSGVNFPAGMMTYIKNVTFSGVGSVGDQENWYPTDMSADSAKTLYGNLSASEHEPYSKIKIEFTFDMRVNKATHAFVDVRLIRWQGSTTAPGTVSHDGANLYWAQTGVVSGGTETYNPIAGSIIDDISGLSGTIYYALQYRNAGGNGTYASTMYAGFATEAIHQMIFTGIV